MGKKRRVKKMGKLAEKSNGQSSLNVDMLKFNAKVPFLSGSNGIVKIDGKDQLQQNWFKKFKE
jgi:hypothetical protein